MCVQHIATKNCNLSRENRRPSADFDEKLSADHQSCLDLIIPSLPLVPSHATSPSLSYLSMGGSRGKRGANCGK